MAGALYGFRESISQKLKSATKVKVFGLVTAEFTEQVQKQTKLVQTITTDLQPLILAAKKEKPEETARLESNLAELKAANNAVISLSGTLLRLTSEAPRVNITSD